MRQVVITRRGGPEVIEVREAPDPVPAPGQVRIRVRAAGVNFAEVMARVGMYPDAPKLPGVMGYEVSGEIDLPAERAGEKVLAMTRFGGHSELVCVPASLVMPIPARLSFVEAAAIPVNWLTAWHMLVELANLRQSVETVFRDFVDSVHGSQPSSVRRSFLRGTGSHTEWRVRHH